jgi:hypothetical protein
MRAADADSRAMVIDGLTADPMEKVQCCGRCDQMSAPTISAIHPVETDAVVRKRCTAGNHLAGQNHSGKKEAGQVTA